MLGGIHFTYVTNAYVALPVPGMVLEKAFPIFTHVSLTTH